MEVASASGAGAGPVEPVTRSGGRRLLCFAATDGADRRLGEQAVEPLEGRFELEKAVALYTARYAIGEVPRPPYWSGFRVVPEEIEFWRDGAFRLHERVRFSRAADGGWSRAWLFP